MGSRYGGLKQLDPVGPNGETLLDYCVYDAIQAGFDRLVFVIRRVFEQEFRAAVGARYEKALTVDYVFQEMADLPGGFTPPPERVKPWGTGHAVLAARDAIREPFAVINADDFYGAEAFQILARALGGAVGEGNYTIVAYELAQTLSEHGAVSRGICRTDAAGLLRDIREVTGIEPLGNGPGAWAPLADGTREEFTGQELVSMNCWGFTADFLPRLEHLFEDFLQANAAGLKAEFYLPAAVDQLIQAGKARVGVHRTGGAWFGMTHRDDRPRVQARIAELIAAGAYKGMR
jgi:dTDP-glucose pyrophosphorylase